MWRSKCRWSFALGAGLVVAALAGAGCGAAAGSGPAAGPAVAAPRGPAPGTECEYLRERVVTASTRLGELIRDGAHSSAKFGAIADVLEKLAADTNVPMARADVRALASDYHAAARAAAAGARDVAALLAKGEQAKARLASGGERKVFLDAVLRVAEACRGSSAADCARAVDILRSLGAAVPTVASLASTRQELAGLVVGTPALRAALPDVETALARLSELLAAGELLRREGPALVAAYERAARQFTGLSARGTELCGKKN